MLLSLKKVDVAVDVDILSAVDEYVSIRLSVAAVVATADDVVSEADIAVFISTVADGVSTTVLVVPVAEDVVSRTVVALSVG